MVKNWWLWSWWRWPRLWLWWWCSIHTADDIFCRRADDGALLCAQVRKQTLKSKCGELPSCICHIYYIGPMCHIICQVSIVCHYFVRLGYFFLCQILPSGWLLSERKGWRYWDKTTGEDVFISMIKNWPLNILTIYTFTFTFLAYWQYFDQTAFRGACKTNFR